MPSLRLLALATALSTVGVTGAQAYFSTDNLFCSPDYLTPSPVSFTLGSGGGSGKVNVQDFHITSGRTKLSADGSVQQIDLGFACSMDWSWGASNPVSGSGAGKMSVAMQYGGTSSDGTAQWKGVLNSLDCVARGENGGRRQTMMIRESPTLDSVIHFSYQKIVFTGNRGVHPFVSGFEVDSSFDTFIDASVDNGASWTTSDSAGHFQGTPEPASVAAMVFGLASLLRRRAKRS